MAINAADARQLARVILLAYFEDVQTIAMILKPLRTEWPSINWMTELTAVATQWVPFQQSGLSVDWWLNEVDRLSQP
jgi:hypothetical protein